jgi:hypothetical protein
MLSVGVAFVARECLRNRARGLFVEAARERMRRPAPVWSVVVVRVLFTGNRKNRKRKV